VAIKGCALTSRQIQLLSRFTNSLVLALDSDSAGNQAVWRGAEIAEQWAMEVEVVQIVGGKDPDEVVRKGPELWKQLLSKAVPIYDYFIDSSFSRFKGETAGEKRKIGQILVPSLAKISNRIIQSHYIRVLAERLGVAEEAIVREVEKFTLNQPSLSSFFPNIRGGDSKERREVLEEYLLALGFQSGKWKLLAKKKVLSLLRISRFLKVLETLRYYLKEYKVIDSQRLEKMIPPELMEAFNRLYLLDVESVLRDEEGFNKEFQKTLLELERLCIREEMEKITKEMERVENQGKGGRVLEELSSKFRALGLKLVEVGKRE